MKTQWYCVWCGKYRTKAPIKEQENLKGEWKPLCSYCQRKRENLTLGDPIASAIIKFRTISTDQGV